MNNLSETWFADGYIDFELKKYTILAYLQHIKQFFNQNKLYPQLAELIFHYNNIIAFRENKRYLQEQFPKRLTGIQLQKLKLLYESMIEDDELMEELEQIVHYAANKMKTTIEDGTSIYEFVENKIAIEPVGLVPLDTKEGYFFLASEKEAKTRVYQYRMSFFEKHDEKYRSMVTEYIDSWHRNFTNTYVGIKTELIKKRSFLPNPAVYAIEIPLKFPIEETVLPIVKRSLAKYLST